MASFMESGTNKLPPQALLCGKTQAKTIRDLPACVYAKGDAAFKHTGVGQKGKKKTVT